MSRRDFLASLHVIFFSLVFLFGYLEEFSPFLNLSERTVRITIIIFIFLYSISATLLSINKEWTSSIFALSALLLIVYAFLVSTLRGGAIDALSSFLRLVSFILIFSWAYGILAINPQRSRELLEKFFVFSASLIILQTLVDYVMGRYVFMNGGERYYGSVGSPIGFAASALIVQIGIIYFWVESSRKKYFLLMLGLLWVVLMTGTRSISVFSLLLIWVGWLFKSTGWLKLLCFTAAPAAAILLVFFMPDISVASRISGTISDGSVDNSTQFRIFILETYFSNIRSDEVFFGLGLGQFHKWFMEQTAIVDVAPHFEFLWILSEFGLFGSILYLAIGASLALGFLSRFRYSPSSQNFLFLSAFLIPQTFLQLANPFYFYQFYVPYALLLAMALSNFDLFRLKAFKKT